MSILSLNIPSPVQRIDLNRLNIDKEIYIKRDDLIHPIISGNKWRKLLGVFQSYDINKYDGIVSFGGAYSNHLHALAHCCFKMNIPCAALVRSLGQIPDNPTMRDCREFGMKLRAITPKEYSNRYNYSFTFDYSPFESPLIIPEGGNGELARIGCYDIITELDFVPDIIFIAVGTGTTMRYMTEVSPCPIWGISPFKAKIHIPHAQYISSPNRIIYDYHFKGFGRFADDLVHFANIVKHFYQINLDMIYNVKAFYGMIDLMNKGVLDSFDKILYIHSGGLQGNRGFFEKYSHKKSPSH